MRIVTYMLLAILSILGLFALNTFFTVASTPSRVIEKTLKTDNVISSYEWYFDTNASYQARVSQIRQFEKWLSGETDPNELRRLRTELGAMQQSCRELSTEYAANSSKLNKQFFKSKNLPETLNPETCESAL